MTVFARRKLLFDEFTLIFFSTIAGGAAASAFVLLGFPFAALSPKEREELALVH